MSYYLETENVVKQYSGHKALDGVSIHVSEGRIYGLLGPNGAGKSSLIRIINNITAPDNGQVFYKGRPMRVDDIATIGYLPEERGLYKKMKVAEQAIYLAQLKGVPIDVARKRLRAWMEKFEIMDWADKKLEELSKGMQQKVQFIITVLHDPDLLIFDEPFSGFDPVNAQLIRDEIMGLKKKGKTIMFSTHNMASVEEICDDIGLINQSHLVLEGQVDDIRESHRKGLYLIKSRLPKDPAAAEQLLHNNGCCTLESMEKDERYWIWTVRKNPEVSGHEVFRYFANEMDVLSFEELIPTMNEIFIQTVKNN